MQRSFPRTLLISIFYRLQTGVLSSQNAWHDEYVQLANGNRSNQMLSTIKVLDYTIDRFRKIHFKGS